jgi:hypothetical protein
MPLSVEIRRRERPPNPSTAMRKQVAVIAGESRGLARGEPTPSGVSEFQADAVESAGQLAAQCRSAAR